MDGASSHPSECSSNISLARNIRPEMHSTVARSSNWKHMSRAMSTASSLCKMNTRNSSLTISSADAFNIVLRTPPRWPPALQRTTEDQLFGNPRETHGPKNRILFKLPLKLPNWNPSRIYKKRFDLEW
ncbi:hypothetical protein L3Y34_019813 [Caenorhabditis briggsae]|uniref:Uncharacterized protein n=1 Tax=Caenorhabditis briggsae TaxID=6238 RepID=A0AAE9DPZ5_CAEBR|nr:hypothetical protein L3Y34_019813 [Caenorhabditis briggsae]